jgi:hypothetical protein
MLTTCAATRRYAVVAVASIPATETGFTFAKTDSNAADSDATELHEREHHSVADPWGRGDRPFLHKFVKTKIILYFILCRPLLLFIR